MELGGSGWRWMELGGGGCTVSNTLFYLTSYELQVTNYELPSIT